MPIPKPTKRPVWRHKRITGAMTPAPNGQWMKKWKSKPYYFGKWSDQQAALVDWRARWPGITDSGTDARFAATQGVVKTLGQLSLAFLETRTRAVARGKLRPKTATKYLHACARMERVLGSERLLATIGPAQFAALMIDAKRTMGVYRIADFITLVRTIFNWAEEEKGIDVVYGDEFDAISRKELREESHRKRREPLSPESIWKLHDAADLQFQAMILLGINAGFGNSDCSELLVTDVRLDDAVIDAVRPKTKALRKAPLWPETVAALRKIMPVSGHVFLQPNGRTWVTEHDDMIGETFKALAVSVGVKASFYDFRRTFGSVTDEIGDERAVKLIMGHVNPDVLELYKNRRSLPRLLRVTDYVRAWLLASRPPAQSGASPDATPPPAWASVS